MSIMDLEQLQAMYSIWMIQAQKHEGQMMTNGANNNAAVRSEVRYLPSNGTTANVVNYDLDLHFQGHKFFNVNISKMVTASEKCSRMTIMKIEICIIWDHYECYTQ